MLRRSLTPSPPGRVLMTVDAVGGVWRYGVDAARGLAARGIDVLLAGLGPPPSDVQRAELDAIPGAELVWLEETLDWLVDEEQALDDLPAKLQALVCEASIDLVQLNAPTQAAGVSLPVPVVVMSHSCVVTWWQAVRAGELPPTWTWQRERNRRGLLAADLVVAPSRSHAAALARAYGAIPDTVVVPNTTRPVAGAPARRPEVFAAARWWDPGKNAAGLDAAAALCRWPVVMAGATRGPNGEAAEIRNARAIGELSGAETRARLGAASIVACPSLYEPFGLVALEAASSGAALVLADIATFRELWSGAALFADPLDPAAFAAALDRLSQDGAERRRLGEAARARAATFGPDRQIDGLVAAYRAATGRHLLAARLDRITAAE